MISAQACPLLPGLSASSLSPVWPQRGLSIPRADLLCSSLPWLPRQFLHLSCPLSLTLFPVRTLYLLDGSAGSSVCIFFVFFFRGRGGAEVSRWSLNSSCIYLSICCSHRTRTCVHRPPRTSHTGADSVKGRLLSSNLLCDSSRCPTSDFLWAAGWGLCLSLSWGHLG